MGVSLSARRAWIEIPQPGRPATTQTVALRKESVDRNVPSFAWYVRLCSVALRKESVDRNVISPRAMAQYRCRSPQGERG